jgi:1-deoxy-D-xylulose-5-phosphate reductoisomerase
MHDLNNTPRRLIVLGSTGSIGVNTLEVVDHLAKTNTCNFEVVGLAAGTNGRTLAEQARRFNVRQVAVADLNQAAELQDVAHVYRGADSALELITSIAKRGDLVVGAMVGSAGIPAILAAIDRGCDIALANKETLVAAGALVMPLASARGVKLIPVDSEHSAIFQCLEGATVRRLAAVEESTESNGEDLSASRVRASIRRVVLTASGGPFRTWSKQRMQNATLEEALNHPTWNMGPKVTIDSASLMNKALEMIEAHWLFELPAEQIEVIIHPQSLIHSFVEFNDNSILAQLGPPDMRTPIQYALTWPVRCEGISRALDWNTLRKMDFEPVDRDRFIAPDLAYDTIRRGGTSGAVLNAANEAAVAAFLKTQISFGRIAELVSSAMVAIPGRAVHTISDIFDADREAHQFVRSQVGTPTERTGLTAASASP